MIKKIRVMIVDDSKYMRYVLTSLLGADPEIEVVGEAANGQEALRLIPQLNPDVITLDVEMPRMDGLQTLQVLFTMRPTPVIMVSNYTKAGGEIAIRALELGALDCVQKPEGRDALTMKGVREELLAKVKMAAGVVHDRIVEQPAAPSTPAAHRIEPRFSSRMNKLIVIGSSTGGPKTLCSIMRDMPADISAGILIIQHMPPGFTASLANRLDNISQLSVSEASEGDRIAPGKALVAPGDFHMELSKDTVRLTQNDKENGVRPAIDVTLRSVAASYGDRVVGVILTGMGRDGAVGGAAVHERGGRMIAQSPDTCVVDGMPKALINSGHADKVVPLENIAAEILSHV